MAPDVAVIDLSHEIPPQDIRTAAFQLKVSVPFFPAGALFVCIVDPGVGSSRKILYARTKFCQFLAPDNGILSWVFLKQTPVEIRSVENKKLFLSSVSRTFQGRDIFAPVAARLSMGLPANHLGPNCHQFVNIPFPKPLLLSEKIEGEVMVIDRFGDVVSNLDEKIINRFEPSRSRLQAKIKSRPLKFCHSYADASSSVPCALIGSFGFLEVASKNGNAARMLKVGPGDKVILERQPVR